MTTSRVALATQTKIVEVTPVLDTNIYANGDCLSDTFAIPIGRMDGMGGLLTDLVVIDKGKVKTAFDILLFDESPTVASAKNAAIDITDAEMTGKYIGKISVAAADFSDLANSSEANVAGLNRLLEPVSTAASIYGVLVVRSGTPTYASDGLVLKFKIAQD